MMIRAATLFAALLALSLTSAADDKKEDPKSDEKLLVGKWKLVKLNPGELPEGLEIVLDVQKDGKFKITVTSGGEKDVNEGTWKLDKKKFAIEFTEGNRKGNKQTDTVKELTEKKLVLLDERDITEEWERVPEKKEKGDK
jgi:uncharacterized protein (TIGR03066 family)